MYDHQTQGEFFYAMLYGAVAMMSLMACCYLLFRRSNAVAPDVTSSVRLRRWTATFFACIALSHIWYLPIFFLSSNEEIMLNYFVGALLDFMTLIPSAIALLLVMLQDRRRPLWPICVIVAPPIVVLAVGFATRSLALLPLLYVYYLLLGSGLIIYMVHEVRRYGRWLRDNYADLEHKEVWQSLVVLAILLLVFGIYSFAFNSMIREYIVQVNNMILICYLLWRVETLSDLSIQKLPGSEVAPPIPEQGLPIPAYAPISVPGCEVTSPDNVRTSPAQDLTLLLQKYCIDAQLYLQHDLTIIQLAKAIGTNRLYLSQYFSSRGMNYNAYINDLRINHFIRLYREAVAAQRSFAIKQLAHESGYRSYNTFSDAFKRKTGLPVTAWMKAASEPGQS